MANIGKKFWDDLEMLLIGYCVGSGKNVTLSKLPNGGHLIYVKPGTEDVFTPLAQAAIEIESKKG